MCLFTSFALNVDDYAGLFTIYRRGHKADDILKTGDLIWNLERIWNLKAGIDPSQDKLPKRLMEETIPSRPIKGQKSHLKNYCLYITSEGLG